MKGKKTCKYYPVCGSPENCARCKGYEHHEKETQLGGKNGGLMQKRYVVTCGGKEENSNIFVYTNKKLLMQGLATVVADTKKGEQVTLTVRCEG